MIVSRLSRFGAASGDGESWASNVDWGALIGGVATATGSIVSTAIAADTAKKQGEYGLAIEEARGKYGVGTAAEQGRWSFANASAWSKALMIGLPSLAVVLIGGALLFRRPARAMAGYSRRRR